MKCNSLYMLCFCLNLSFILAQSSLPACPSSVDLSSEKAYRYHYKLWIPLYEIRLKKPEAIPPAELFSGAHPFTLEFTYLRPIEKSLIIHSSLNALANNLDSESLLAIQPAVDALNQVYTSVKKNDQSAFIYCPNHGTQFYLNGELKETIEGTTFPDHYFRIWFGNKPLSKSLKAHLLEI